MAFGPRQILKISISFTYSILMIAVHDDVQDHVNAQVTLVVDTAGESKDVEESKSEASAAGPMEELS